MVTIGCHWATKGIHLQWPTTSPSPKLGLTTPVKTCITNCCQMVPDITVARTDSLWEHPIALPSSAIVNPLRARLPPKRGSQGMPTMGRVVGFPYLLVWWSSVGMLDADCLISASLVQCASVDSCSCIADQVVCCYVSTVKISCWFTAHPVDFNVRVSWMYCEEC